MQSNLVTVRVPESQLKPGLRTRANILTNDRITEKFETELQMTRYSVRLLRHNRDLFVCNESFLRAKVSSEFQVTFINCLFLLYKVLMVIQIKTKQPRLAIRLQAVAFNILCCCRSA